MAVPPEGEIIIIDLFTGLLEYIYDLLLIQVTLGRTVPKGDGKVGIEICVSSSCLIIGCVFYLFYMISVVVLSIVLL